MDKSQTTSLQDMDSHHDYLIKKGLMKTPQQFKKDFDETGVVEFRTDLFLSLSDEKQRDLIKQYTEEWWNQFDDELNEESVMIKTNIPDNPFDEVDDGDDEMYVSKDTPEYWDSDDDDNLTDEEWEEFEEYLKSKDREIEENRIKTLTGKLIDEDSLVIDTIRKNIQKRRRDGGCSMWRDVGLKWIYDKGRYDLLKYDWEKDYIDKHYKKLNEE